MNTITLNHAPATSHQPLVKRAFAATMRFFELRRQHKHLSQLGPELLNDIGLCAADLRAELDRPLWDAPIQFTLK